MTAVAGWLGAGTAGLEARAARALPQRLPCLAEESVAGVCKPGWGLYRAVGRVDHYWNDGDSVLYISGRWQGGVSKTTKEADGRAFAAGTARRLRDGDVAGALRGLRGSFVLVAVWDGGREALLACDRFATTPMFWAEHGGQVLFATELPALLALYDSPPAPAPQAIFNYLYFHMIPSPGTIYAGIQRLPPGSFLRVRDGKATVRGWATTSIHEGAATGASLKTLAEEFRTLVEQAVRRSAEGETAVGCFLSGGTDSSTVTGYAGLVSGAPARTFSIGFDEAGYDETDYARVTARHFNTKHHEYYVTADDIVDLVPRIATVYGEPFGNSSVIPAYYCARLAGQDGVRTMLAGDGGDELFGGNSRYAKEKLFDLYYWIPALIRRVLLEPVVFGFPGGAHILPVRKARRYIEQARLPMPDRMESYNLAAALGAAAFCEPDFLEQVDADAPLAHLREVWRQSSAVDLVERMLALDWRITLADNDLRKVGRMCALAGVDVRYPLLDEDLFEFSLRLPAEMKVHGFKLRWFFKHALKDVLPPAVIAKAKHGFGLPFGAWVLRHRRLGELVRDSLSDLGARGVIRRDFIGHLLGERLAEAPGYYGTFVWLLLILESWYRESTGVVSTGAAGGATVAATHA